jgi:1,4-dihydroxy-6-naphthoate synthase
MSIKRLKLAISPCPNDTFIFGPWINNFVKTETDLELEVDYLDIQELNEQSLNYKYDLIKISAAHIPFVLSEYAILSCGGALTDKTGPLLIARNSFSLEELNNKRILLPGINTTAAFLFSFLFPDAKNLDYTLFSEIEDRILKNEADAGVIIHESRFNYESKGLQQILDLGEEWYTKTKCPIPLGVIAIKRSINSKLKLELQDQIRKSINWAIQNEEEIMPYIVSKATEMDKETISKHIELYVNDYSINLGGPGKIALMKLCNYLNRGKINPNQVFI